MKLHGWIIAGVSIIACGCVNQPGGPRAAAPTGAPIARALDPKALLALDQIEPRPVLGKPRPATQPAPLDAVVLYAQARDKLIQKQAYTAITLIERALLLDPDSFELNYWLGRTYAGMDMKARAVTAFERAAEINPNNLEIQTELGRAFQGRDEADKAIERFRLAQQTDSYKEGDSLAAVVDYRLGLLLQQHGYVKAALECYTRLQSRLERPNGMARGSPEVIYLLSRPELVYEEIGRMHEELGNLPQALLAYQRVAAESPDEFAPRARVIRLLVRLNRGPEALKLAAELVRSSRASLDSITLLREIHEKTGGRNNFVDELRRLNKEHPDDRALLFALADTLAGSGQVDQASQLLNREIVARGADVEIVQRLYRIYADRDQVNDAAKVILAAISAHPQNTLELEPLLNELTRLSRKNALRLATLTKLDVPPSSEAAKQYFIAQVAVEWNRASVARHALEQAVKITPPFDPAFRLLVLDHLSRSDWEPEARQRAVQALIQSVRAAGREDLAEELSGHLAVATEQIDQAVLHFAQAVRLAPPTGPSPDLQIEYAMALRQQGNIPRFEQILWKLVSERPRCTDAYTQLLDHYERGNAEAQAWNVRNTWIAADPQNVRARLKLIDGLIQVRRGDEAIAQMRRLFDDHPDDGAVVGNLISLLRSIDQGPQLIELLEAERFRHPNNRIVVEALMMLYTQQGQPNDAARVLDSARAAVASDPDLLYYVANLYHRIDQPQMTEQVLQDVLKLDPNHAQAGNDLGYTWADAGKNMDQAESLVRIAVKAEPDNPSYLDSLGWVLYKRSKFEEATKLLQQASEPAESADPIVLDHLGDALYRGGKSADAQATWENALKRSAAELVRVPGRSDIQELQLQLQTKLRQAVAGQPVNVAPVVDSPPNGQQQTSSTGQNNGRP